MALRYKVIEIFTGEAARWEGKPVHVAVVEHVAKAGIAARCIVHRGIAGCYETGEMATTAIEVWSVNLPVKIEIVLPAAELDILLPQIEAIVEDGIVCVVDRETVSHRVRRWFIPPHLKVRDAMTPDPACVGEDTPLDAVVRLLLQERYNGMPVVGRNRRPVGIITQGDLVKRAGMPVRLGLLTQFRQHQLDDLMARYAGMRAGDVMTRPVYTLYDDLPLARAVDDMLKRGFKRLPVVDHEERLVGILARFDVFRAITSTGPDWGRIRGQQVTVTAAQRVAEVVQRDTQTVPPEAPIAEVIRLIGENPVQRVAVVDGSGRLLGLVTDRDILEAFAEHREGLWDLLSRNIPFTEAARQHRELAHAAAARTARDLMKTDLVTVGEEDGIDHAIELMARHNLKRLPVIDADGRFAGMVSRNALLRAGTENE